MSWRGFTCLISSGPKHSHQHQTNRGHAAEDLCPLQLRSERFRQAGIEQRQRQQQQPTDKNDAGGGGHQAILDWQNRHILLKCVCDA